MNGGILSSDYDMDFFLAVAMGKVPRHSIVSIIGHNPAAGTSKVTVWEEGTQVSFPSATITDGTVSSSSINDDSGGSGTQDVIVYYIDENDDYATAFLTMDGQNGVSMPNYKRVNSIVGGNPGTTNGSNDGNIYVGNGAIASGKPTNVHCTMAAGDGISHNGFYSIARNHELHLVRLNITADSNKNVNFYIDQYLNSLGGHYVEGTAYVDRAGVGEIKITPSNPYPAQTDIFFQTISSATNSNVRINAAGILKRLVP